MTRGPTGRLPAGLLVSVRSVAEAEAAIAGGAAIIDVKEPANGPLGAAEPALAAAIGAAVGRRVPWTLACGELSRGADRVVDHVRRVIECGGPGMAPPAAAKAGPAGLHLAAWRGEHARLFAGLPAGVEAVAVAYADWESAAAPEPSSIIAAAAAAGAATVLVDTFDKSGPGLLDLVGPTVIRDWQGIAAPLGGQLAVAGRLRVGEVEAAARCGAAVIGVRSAACGGTREGRVDAGHVAALVATLAGCRGPSAGVLTGVCMP